MLCRKRMGAGVAREREQGKERRDVYTISNILQIFSKE